MTVSGLLLFLLVCEDGCMITHCMACTEDIDIYIAFWLNGWVVQYSEVADPLIPSLVS